MIIVDFSYLIIYTKYAIILQRCQQKVAEREIIVVETVATVIKNLTAQPVFER